MTLLLQITETAPYSISLGLAIGVGFLVAVTVGSIAWYNSKRPAGWENADRPDIIPNIEK